MKKIILFLFVLSLKDCYAATGNANDGLLFAVSVMLILLLILAAGYFIDFLKGRIKATLAKRKLKHEMKGHDEDFENSCIKALPELNVLSGL
jgi:hypothetical protein